MKSSKIISETTFQNAIFRFELSSFVTVRLADKLIRSFSETGTEKSTLKITADASPQKSSDI